MMNFLAGDGGAILFFVILGLIGAAFLFYLASKCPKN